MRKGLMLTSVAGALSMVLGGAALAANHVPPTGGWSVADGKISKTPDYCTGGNYSCSIVATGPGFMQLSVSAAAGKTVPTLGVGESFIQTIVTNQDETATNPASAKFYDVSFVKMSLSLGGQQTVTQNGIFGQQSITETKGATTVGGATEAFTSSTTIATGWGLESAGAPSIQITQAIDNQGGQANTQSDDFKSGFSYKATIDDKGVRNGLSMDISQVAGLKGTNGSDTDVQAFALRERSGSFNPAAGTTASVGGKTIPWVAGDDMKAIWVGQNINLATDINTPGQLGSAFGYLSFENLNKAVGATDRLASEFGFANSNASSAWAWTPGLFGTAPTLNTP